MKMYLNYWEHASMALLVGVAAIAAASGAARAEAPGCKQARTFVGKVSTKVAGALAAPGARVVRERRFARVFHNYADFMNMNRFALGRYARSLPKSLKTAYYGLAERLALKNMFSKFGAYNGQSYKIQSCNPRGNGYVVGGAIVRRNGSTVIDVNWRLSSTKSRRLKVLDISVAHFWMNQHRRSFFVSVISKARGDHKALLAYMRNKIRAKRT